jgi:hypothetical protein
MGPGAGGAGGQLNSRDEPWKIDGMRCAISVMFAIAACSEDAAPPAPDAKPKDAGAGDDAGVHPDATDEADASLPDAAEIDSGAPDTGVPDAGFPPDTGADAGMSLCPDGMEGCLCGLGGMCSDQGLACLDSSGGLVPPQDRTFLCVRPCQIDDDCLNDPVGNRICRAVFGATKGCVSAEVVEGEIATISRLSGGAMTGCEDGTIGIPPFVGLRLPEDQVSCGRPCTPGVMSGPGACTPTYPACNDGFLNSPATPGLCMARRAGPGDTCSRSSVVGLCDNTVPNLACIGIPYSILDPADPSPMPDPGMCMQSCDLGAPDCAASDDPGAGPATCRQVTTMNPMVGVCSNDCSFFPNDCQRPGAFGEGTTCTRELFFEMGFPVTFCFNVMPPPIAEWNFGAPPIERCMTSTGGEARCEAGTICADDGAGGVCVRPCKTSTPTGCEMDPAGNGTCNDDVFTGMGDGLGVCTPP